MSQQSKTYHRKRVAESVRQLQEQADKQAGVFRWAQDPKTQALVGQAQEIQDRYSKRRRKVAQDRLWEELSPAEQTTIKTILEAERLELVPLHRAVVKLNEEYHLGAILAVVDPAALAGPQSTTAAAVDERAWVPAATLWEARPEFQGSRKKLDKFRANHPEMFRNSSRFKLQIHAGLWTAHWATLDKLRLESLDGNHADLPSLADDLEMTEAALASARQQMAAMRKNKAQKAWKQ